MAMAPDTTYPLRDADDWLVLLPPQPVSLSPMQIRLLLRVTLPQPVLDLIATLEVINYQQRHKQHAYVSHRARRLRRAHHALAPPLVPHTSHLGAVLALPRSDHVSL
jgi:hypothetical protein